MIRIVGISAVLIVLALSVIGCDVRLPGQPDQAERWRAPGDISDFNQLYRQNCSGCHGADGRRGAARSLNDPLYQSFVTDDAMQQVIAEGRAGTNMPAFSQQAGGNLTDKQIALLVSGMRSQWARPEDFKGQELPRYSVNPPATNTAASANDLSVSTGAKKGAATYQIYCAGCHGANGAGGPAGSIVDPSFLTMVSDQGLRTTVVVGRADLGKPDWRANLPGRPMSPQEIDDVVAWLIAQRKAANAIRGEGSQVSQVNLK